MKILGNYFAITALVLGAAACNNAPEATVESKEAEETVQPEVTTATYRVVENADSIHWVGFKTYSDDAHSGSILVKEGEFMVEGDQLVGGSFIIDMNSIQDHDIANEEYKQKLEGHLKSPDFFDVANHPTAKFEITGIEAVESAESGATHNISGNLEMRGNSRNVSIPAIVSMNDNSITVKTPEFVIDRTEWNVMYGSSNLGDIAQDKLIDNSIKLTVDIKAEKA